MRIRQEAKLAGVRFSNAGISSGGDGSPVAIYCHLSQSPWDAISFPPDSDVSPYQIEGDAFVTPNVSLGGSLAATESFDLMKSSEKANTVKNHSKKESISVKKKKKVEEEEKLGNNSSKNREIIICCKTDGKSWKCKKEAAQGQTLCQHHLDQLKSYSAQAQAQAHTGPNERSKHSVASERPLRMKKRGRGADASNPYEMYYYAGFGPKWGKQRGARASPSKRACVDVNIEEYDYVDDYDEDEEDGDDEMVNGEDGEVAERKKARKPIKARSLKSLM